MSLYVGSLVHLTAVYKDLAQSLVDPTSVTCEVIAPDGTRDGEAE